jgi:predicted nucleotidyltransferase
MVSLSHGVAVEEKEKRLRMLNVVKEFLPVIKRTNGVQFIGLIGSITRDSPNPKDIDFVVCVTPSADLSELATIFRRIAGRMSQIGKGADMFVYDDGTDKYLGRICPYRECAPGTRRCDADHCGMRPYLKDDLSVLRLPPFARKKVPVELHPTPRYNPPQVPADVSEMLLGDRPI